MQGLFDTLRNHGHLFSLPLWEKVFDSVLFPIFDYVRHAIDPSGRTLQEEGIENNSSELDQDAWLYETCTLALQLVVDLFVKFYDTVNPLLRKILMLLTSFIKRPHQSLAGIGIAAFVRLMSNAGSLFLEDKWFEVVTSLKEAAGATLPDFTLIMSLETHIVHLARDKGNSSVDETNEESEGSADDMEGLRSRTLYFAISDARCRAAVQLLLLQVCILMLFSFTATYMVRSPASIPIVCLPIDLFISNVASRDPFDNIDLLTAEINVSCYMLNVRLDCKIVNIKFSGIPIVLSVVFQNFIRDLSRA